MKTFKSTSIVKCLFALGLIIILPSLSLAEIGGDENTIEKDRTHFGAKLSIRKSTNFQIYDLTSNYNSVHEYMDTKGRVFAVSWDGQIPPDLSVLFGGHFSEFKRGLAGLAPRRGMRNFQNLVTDHLHIIQAGHLHHWVGSAYLVGKIPAGVSMQDLIRTGREN